MTKKEKSKVFTPEFKSQFITGTFVDYAGNKRNYTMCAVSIPCDAEITIGNTYACYGEKLLSIGVSVCSVADSLNEEIGKRIAYGKATTPRSMEHVMVVTHKGMINTMMVDALLKQEGLHFEKDPGSYIAGYDHDKMRYEKTGKTGTAETVTKLAVNNVKVPFDYKVENPELNKKSDKLS